jgi:hypothetical protein
VLVVLKNWIIFLPTVDNIDHMVFITASTGNLGRTD